MPETLGDVLPAEGQQRAVISLEHNHSIGEAMKARSGCIYCRHGSIVEHPSYSTCVKRADIGTEFHS